MLELAVADADKGRALRRLRDELGVAAAVHRGDDLTDEDAFRTLLPGDVSVKVGEGETAARFRIAGPPTSSSSSRNWRHSWSDPSCPRNGRLRPVENVDTASAGIRVTTIPRTIR